MSVGDINSTEKGSGARYNDGKPDYSYMFLDHLVITDNMDNLDFCMYDLGEFQRTDNASKLMDAYRSAYYHAIGVMKDKYVLDPVVRVWQAGAKKYAKWNWAKGMNWSIPLACIARHYLDIMEREEEIDPESGEPHWAHIICNIQMLLLFVETYPEGNDLPFSGQKCITADDLFPECEGYPAIFPRDVISLFMPEYNEANYFYLGKEADE